MKKIKNYNNFILDSILEKLSSKDLPFVLSDRLKEFLVDIDHMIATELLNYHTDSTKTVVTLVDFDDSDSNLFTLAYSNKLKDYIDLEKLTKNSSLDYDNFGYDKEIWTKFRTPIKIGKFVKKIFGEKFEPSGKPGDDIESFTTLVKSKRDKEIGEFEFVKGNDIIKYYNKKSYTKRNDGGSSLHVSCMMYDSCEPYIGFYTNNDVELIIMKDDSGDIKGRALLWKVYKIGDAEVDRKFMDRVYTSRYVDVQKFIDLAIKNNWIYKSAQNSYDYTLLIDPSLDKDSNFIKTISVKNIKEHKAYPYLDTLKFYNINDGILTNDNMSEFDVTLDSTSGGYNTVTGEEFSYDIYSGKIINNDYLVYCDAEEIWVPDEYAVRSIYDDVFMTKEYAEKKYKYSSEEEDWIPNNVAVFVESNDDWVSLDFAESNYIYCAYDNNYYSHDDVYPSFKWDSVPIDKSILVIVDEDYDLNEPVDVIDIGGSVDSRWIDDDTYFEVKSKNNKSFYLDNDLKHSDIVDEIKKGEY